MIQNNTATSFEGEVCTKKEGSSLGQWSNARDERATQQDKQEAE